MWKKVRNKLVGLIHWWLLLEPIEHKHWCTYQKPDGTIKTDEERCYHSGICWYCIGISCIGVERKDCPNCEAGKSKTCLGRFGVRGVACTCGHGRG